MNNGEAGIETTDVRLEGAVDDDTQTTSPDNDAVIDDVEATATQPDATTGSSEQEKKKPWLVPLLVGTFLIVAIAAVAILLLINTNNGNDDGPGRRTGGVAAPDQANWKVTSYSLGGAHPGQTGKAPKQEANALSNLVRRWHDSVYLFPGDFRSDTGKFFTSEAARAVRASGFGLPQGADQVETKKRTARIGIDANGARRAAAEVEVVATGNSRNGEFRVVSETHLWLERDGANWKVIAFDVDQKPQPTDPKKDGKAKGGDGRSGDKPKKGGSK